MVFVKRALIGVVCAVALLLVACSNNNALDSTGAEPMIEAEEAGQMDTMGEVQQADQIIFSEEDPSQDS